MQTSYCLVMPIYVKTAYGLFNIHYSNRIYKNGKRILKNVWTLHIHRYKLLKRKYSGVFKDFNVLATQIYY